MTATTPFAWPPVLSRLITGDDLTGPEARAAMDEIMSGRATPAQTAAFIVSLRTKGETAEEITGLVQGMRDAMIGVDTGGVVVDTAGTGGDRSGTFNISTTAALIAAGAGARVAKHGNRAASSESGSADVLEALGFAIDLPPEATAQMIEETRFGFFFAPRYHPAMRHAGPVRRELGVPTVFNFLGPLCNPAGATRQALGVADPRMAERMIEVLRNLGSEYAFVFYGEDGLDELTVTGPSYIYRLRGGEITHAEFTPEDFGVPRSPAEALRGGDAARNAGITRDVLSGQPGPARDVSLINAAAAIVAAGLAEGFVEGVEAAAAAVDGGAARDVLERAAALSRDLASG